MNTDRHPRNIEDLTESFSTGLRVQWHKPNFLTPVEGVVVFWPESASVYDARVIVLFDGQPMPVEVRGGELSF